MVSNREKFEALPVLQCQFIIASNFPVIALTRNLFSFAEERIWDNSQIRRVAFDIGRIVSVGIERVDSEAAVVRDLVAEIHAELILHLVACACFEDQVVHRKVTEYAVLIADRYVVAWLASGSKKIIEPAALTAQRQGASGAEVLILIAIDTRLVGDAVGRDGLGENDVHDLAAASHIEVARGAADDLELANLGCGDSV